MNKDKHESDDSDESDEDYLPDDNLSDLPSEVESDGGENIEDEVDADDTPKTLKRRKKRPEKLIEKHETNDNEENGKKDGVDDKARTDALWADFLSDTPPISRPTKNKEPPKSNATLSFQQNPSATSSSTAAKITSVSPPNKKQTITEIFEFAGEKVNVTKQVPIESAAASVAQTKTTLPFLLGGSGGIKRSSSAGLSSVLDKIGKKNKISTLEKTKLDWNSFKQDQGIDEDLQTFNKGKSGFLERQDFLQRTDVRQFEIEKNLRATKRSNR